MVCSNRSPELATRTAAAFPTKATAVHFPSDVLSRRTLRQGFLRSCWGYFRHFAEAATGVCVNQPGPREPADWSGFPPDRRLGVSSLEVIQDHPGDARLEDYLRVTTRAFLARHLLQVFHYGLNPGLAIVIGSYLEDRRGSHDMIRGKLETVEASPSPETVSSPDPFPRNAFTRRTAAWATAQPARRTAPSPASTTRTGKPSRTPAA